MTTPLGLLAEAEYVRAILEPFARIIGMEWIIFIIFAATVGWVYIKTQSIAMPLMLVITVFASINMSHLFITEDYPMLPDPFDMIVALIIVCSLGFMLFAALTKK